MILNENDLVTITLDLPAAKLTWGDVGAIVHVYASGTRYEVEFANAQGDTVGVETLTADQIRKADRSRVMFHYADLELTA